MLPKGVVVTKSNSPRWENVRAGGPALPQLPLNAHVSPYCRGPGRSGGCLGQSAFSICQEGSKDVNLQKPSINSFNEVSLLASVEPEELLSMCELPICIQVLSRLVMQEHLTELVPRLHASLLAGWVRSPVSCLCLCGCVGARKQRVLVDWSSSD